jgi:CheY-like chemotaxis protein
MAMAALPESVPEARVLVVDDETNIVELLSVSLKFQGFEVHTASNGPAALDKAREVRPDAVILDVMMPGMDGMEVLRRVRADPKTASTCVVMFSAVADRNFIDEAIRKGANDYWVKASFDFTQLKDRIEHLVPAPEA